MRQWVEQWAETQSRILDWQGLSLDSELLSHYPHAPQLQQWLDQGYHGTMSFMENHLDIRTDLRNLEPGAQTVVQFLIAYPAPLIPYRELEATQAGGHPLVSSYAQGPDYHDFARQILTDLKSYLELQSGGEISVFRPFTDSAPVFERDLAQILGLGWLGKNACLINREHGSAFFLSGFVTDLKLEDSEPFGIQPAQDFCGGCTRCIDACPTEAIESPGVIRAKDCISYYTIEHKGPLEPSQGSDLSDWIFGCDICQQVCPWNHKSIQKSEDEDRASSAEAAGWPKSAEEWLALVALGGGFKSKMKKTPLYRGGRKKILRNLCWYAQNQKNPGLIDLCQQVVSREESEFQAELLAIFDSN